MARVSVVLLNWNGAALLSKFLPSVINCTNADLAEIIVADNNSTDESREMLDRDFPEIRQIHIDENLGYAGGYNEALKQVESEYYVLLNTDVELTENWLTPIISYMDNHSEVIAAQPKILSYKNKTQFEYAGAAGGYMDKYGYPFCRGRIFGTVEEDRGQYDDVHEVFWASGACLVIRSKDFWELGAFDDQFFAHMEEIDLCWRINARGGKVVCIPSSVIYHVGGASLDSEDPHKTFLNFRNNWLMLYKNTSKEEFRHIYWTRLLLDILAAFQFVITGKFHNAEEILHAHKEFRKMRESYNLIRQGNIRKRKQSHFSGFYSKSIVVDYYLIGIKKFSQIEF